MNHRTILLGALALVPFPAIAQTVPDTSPPATASDIVVTARQEKTARDEQKAAPNLVNIQAAETIAKYPDVNAAEAISRIPGVALSIDTSEGRFVNIRGLDGNLNGATFGGVVLLNTQPGGTYFNGAGRAVEFDTVPIGAIDRIVVTKTGTPDHEAEGLGGTIELTPRTAIGAKRLFVDITAGGGIETFRNHALYRDEVVIGGPIGPRNASGDPLFSFVLTQFLYNDRRGFDDLEAAYVNNQPDTPDKAFDALELRRYNYNRKRFGYSGEFDLTPSDGQRFYARVSIAVYNESVQRDRLEIDGLGKYVRADRANANGFVVQPTLVLDDAGQIAMVSPSTIKTLRDEDETHRNEVFQLGGEHHFGEAVFDWFGAYSRATYARHYDYNSTFAGPDMLTIAYDNITNPNYPIVRQRGGADITNSANYALDGINNAREYDRDREWSGAANLSIPLHLLDADALKAGVKLRFRRKSAATVNTSFSYNGPAASLTGFVGDGPFTDFYGRYNIGDGISASKVRDFLVANPTLFDGPTARDLQRNAGSVFDDTENVTAGYAQYQADIGKLGILAGARVEHTYDIFRGIARNVGANGTQSFAPAEQRHNYTDVFPTVQLRYQVADPLILRATYSTGIARPGFFQTIQSSSVNVGAGTVSTGNPNLKPTLGNNFDLQFQYSPSRIAFFSVGVFDKEFSNYAVTRTVRGAYPGITGIATINTYGCEYMPAVWEA